jgi:hypothetical protein
MPLEFQKRKALLGVMASMFSTVDDFRTFLIDRTGRHLDVLSDGALSNRISRVLTKADEQEWLGDLIAALKDVAGPSAKATLDDIDVTGHFAEPQVVAWRTATELAVQDPPALEKIVRAANSLLPIHVWLTRATDIKNRVCRIAVDSGGALAARGSGFLVAADVVLTNHHVIAPLLGGTYDPKHVRAQFDHWELADGSAGAGTIVDLAKDWLIASAPHDPIDTKVHDLTADPKSGNLDFALLRLARKIGSEKKRGWMDLGATASPAAAGAPVFIVQHAAGKPMELALDTNGVIGYTPKQRRIRYRTNTLSGSSGSPVFNQDWELLALHHAGDPKYPDLDTGQYNEGIPIRTLVQYFEDEGILAKL